MDGKMKGEKMEEQLVEKSSRKNDIQWTLELRPA
jgi:hypothetical protein